VGLLATLCTARLLHKRHILAAAAKITSRRLLLARAAAVRAAAVRFVAAAAGSLGRVDTEAQLLPLVMQLLGKEPLSLEVGLVWGTCHRCCFKQRRGWVVVQQSLSL
jgi:hypothetical protein